MKHWGESFSQGIRLLRVVDHKGREQMISFPLGGGPKSPGEPGPAGPRLRRELRIGRDRGADLVLGDPHVAAHHCRIFARDLDLVLVDRGSPGGTRINGVRCVEPTVLHEGDRVELGRTLIEVVPGRSQVDLQAVEAALRHRTALWSQASQTTQQKTQQKTPASGDRPWELWRWALAGLLGGLAVASVLLVSLRAPQPQPPPTTESSAAPPSALQASPPSTEEPPPRPSTQPTVNHEVLEIDTLRGLTAHYRSPERVIREANPELVARDGSLIPGTTLRITTTVEPWEREKIRHRVAEGDTVASLARTYGTSQAAIRAQLARQIGEHLVPGELLELWVPRSSPPSEAGGFRPAPLLLPDDARSVGRPQDGTIDNPLRLLESDAYKVRCSFNAYSTAATIQALDSAIRGMRARHGYRGELVVGDLSRTDGGSYGSHVSHQSGRDVDLWLPVRGGVYRTDCRPHCGTPWCRPEPEEVDWVATWRLVEALLQGGRVERIFLDQELLPALRQGGREAGAEATVLDRVIRHRGAQVIHSAGHKHHIHIRFRCTPEEEECAASLSKPQSPAP